MADAHGTHVPSFPFDSPLAATAVALERLRGDLEAVHTVSRGDTLRTLVASSIARAADAGRLDADEAAALTAVASGAPFASGDLTELDALGMLPGILRDDPPSQPPPREPS
ncbi:hypothetical protein ACT3SP_05115 [Brachybacterium sp. AOP43-C2-M15]|uniref:hypothetical protein n=1 Tax=Brachybacterium sp. AOP43-C2-M15 TaxID=3457661 RepID=UPI0040332D53